MVKISIIIPVYKVPSNYLEECFKSLQAQTMRECEFIVVSDGAPETERSICKKFANQDSRFFFFDKTHKGVSATRNYGLSNAHGEYITFVDADDWINPDYCERIYSFSKSCDSDITFWDCSFFNENTELGCTSFFKESKKRLSYTQIENFQKNIIHFNDATKSVPAITVCKLYRKTFLDKNPTQFNEKLSFGEDRVFSYKISCLTKSIAYLKESLYHCRRHAQSATKKFTPDSFLKSLSYIKELDFLSNDKNAIGQEAFSEFYTSWDLCYMHKENQNSFFKRMEELSNNAKGASFQKFLSKASYSGLTKLQKIELYLLKHKRTFFIWIHGIKHLILEK